MKGIVFNEFISMTDSTFSPTVTEAVINACKLKSAGAYTSVGYYDHQELVTLATELANQTGADARKLVTAFGRFLLGRFAQTHAAFFETYEDAFTLLENVDACIHGEVRKLYPDAELPSVTCVRPAPGQLWVDYRSTRGLADAAEGLINGVIAHYGEAIHLEREDQPHDGGQQWVRFTLTILTD